MSRKMCFVDFCGSVNNIYETTKKMQTHRLGKTPNPNARLVIECYIHFSFLIEGLKIDLGSQDSGSEYLVLQYNGTISSSHLSNLNEHFKSSIALYTFFTIALKTCLHWIGKWKMKWLNLRGCLNILWSKCIVCLLVVSLFKK